MHYLTKTLWFPEPSEASEEGILAVGGDLSPERLLLAYRSGIFPWYDHDQPILWWCPNLRMVLFPKQIKISKSLQKVLKSNEFKITFNTCFSEVIKNCATIRRDGQRGTWITDEMLQAYQKLHDLKHAVSVEVWKGDVLVGGLYGIDLHEQRIFCGESMFSKETDASKVGFVHLVESLLKKNYVLIDCQVYTNHLASLGAEEISRTDFLEYLKC